MNTKRTVRRASFNNGLLEPLNVRQCFSCSAFKKASDPCKAPVQQLPGWTGAGSNHIKTVLTYKDKGEKRDLFLCVLRHKVKVGLLVSPLMIEVAPHQMGRFPLVTFSGNGQIYLIHAAKTLGKVGTLPKCLGR